MNHRTSLTKWIWKTIRPHRKHLALVASLALFDAAFANVIPLFWRKVVNDAVAGNTNWTIIFGFCVFIIVSEMPIFTVQNELLAHRYRHTVSRLVLHWVLGLSPE